MLARTGQGDRTPTQDHLAAVVDIGGDDEERDPGIGDVARAVPPLEQADQTGAAEEPVAWRDTVAESAVLERVGELPEAVDDGVVRHFEGQTGRRHRSAARPGDGIDRARRPPGAP